MLQIFVLKETNMGFFNVNIDQGIHKGKSKAAQIEKGKITTTWVFLYIKYTKFRIFR